VKKAGRATNSGGGRNLRGKDIRRHDLEGGVSGSNQGRSFHSVKKKDFGLGFNRRRKIIEEDRNKAWY